MASRNTETSYPSEWIGCRLGDVLTLINGRAYKKTEMLHEGTPILRIQNLNGGENWFYSDLELPEDKYCEKGDLLYAWSATFGPYWSRWDHKLIYHYHIWKVKPSRAATKEFAFYELWRITEDLKAAAHGVAMPHITKAGMEDWEVVLPSLAEQKQIAVKLDELLEQVDTIKTRLDAIPAILKRFRQSVLAAAVSGRLTEEWRDFEAFGDKVSIGEVAIDIRYGTSKKCDYESGETPVLRIPNIGDGILDLKDLKFANFEVNEQKKLALKEGDLLLIRSNGSVDLVGKVAVVTPNDTRCLFAGYLIRLRIDVARARTKYILYCLQSPQIRKVIEIQARSTSGVNNINSKELAALTLFLPSIEEQKEIVRQVGQIFTFADQIEQRVKDAQSHVNHLTQSILAKAFRGELTAEWREQNPDLINGENSAQALLERIKAEQSKLNPTKRGRRKKAQ